MGLRMSRRIRIAKGLSVNISSRGISTSAKVGRVTVNSRRGATVRVAKGVSYHAPAGSPQTRATTRTVARPAPQPVVVAPAGPRYVRRPFGMAGALYWTLGIVAALLLGAVPYAGPVLLLGAIAALIVLWVRTPKREVSR